MKTIHSIRLVASFALLGAVIAGILTGWVTDPPVDYRIFGALIGAAAASLSRPRTEISEYSDYNVD